MINPKIKTIGSKPMTSSLTTTLIPTEPAGGTDVMQSENKEIISDDFMEWEERDSTQISLFKHCVCGKSFSRSPFLWSFRVTGPKWEQKGTKNATK